MTDIKTQLTDELCEILATVLHFIPREESQLATDVQEMCSRLRSLEAAPASSAMAQAVDAQRITEIWRECQTAAAKEFFETVRPDGVTGKDSVPVRFAYALFAEAALQSQQSPVQASDAGRNG